MIEDLRVAMLISGGGTTANAIIEACNSGKLKGVRPVCVIASTPEAGGIERVQSAGMSMESIHVVEPKKYRTPAEFGEALLSIFKKHEADFVGQYGWLAKTPTNVIEAYPRMMVNQHPGPLEPGKPDFGGPGMYGRRVHAARLLFVRRVNRDFWSEATAQRVAVEFDKGAVLRTKAVPILPGDDVPALAERMLPVEYELQIETLRDFATGHDRDTIRLVPLVKAGEEAILEECKKEAKRLYPNG